jgi:transposase InsO family protein
VHHADRGRPYARQAYRHRLAAHGNVGRRSQGDGLDDAIAERFFGRLKREWTSPCEDATHREAKDDVMTDIEMFYNRRRK